MISYSVIWRTCEDDFLITVLDLEPGHIEKLSNQDVVEMCWDEEYGDLDEPNPFRTNDPPSYDMIDILSSDAPIHFHRK